MRIEPFKPYHLRLLAAAGVQASQRGTIGALYAELAGFQHPGGAAFTGWCGELLVGCGGVVITHGKLGVAWVVLSSRAGPHMLAITRAVQRYLSIARLQRIEATVEAGFAPGDRWLKRLGFLYEGPLFNYGPNGELHHRWAFVPPGSRQAASTMLAIDGIVDHYLAATARPQAERVA